MLTAAQEDVRYGLSVRSAGASVAGDAWYPSIVEEVLETYLLCPFYLRWMATWNMIRLCFVDLMGARRLAITVSPPVRGAGRERKCVFTQSQSPGSKGLEYSARLPRLGVVHRRRLRLLLDILASLATTPCLRKLGIVCLSSMDLRSILNLPRDVVLEFGLV
jgi:hypothetical protein